MSTTLAEEKLKRIIGIRSRVKKTTKGEERPTQVAILEPDGTLRTINLEDTEAETDFVEGTFPIAWRDVEPSDDPSKLRFISHGQWVLVGYTDKKGWHPEVENEELYRPEHRMKVKKGRKTYVYALTKVATAFEGLQPRDRVAMTFGSGNALALTILDRSKEIGGIELFRCSTKTLRDQRGEFDTKNEDAELLARFLRDQPSLFYLVEERQKRLIQVSVAFRDRLISMKRRIKVGQQFLQIERDQAVRKRTRRSSPAVEIEDVVMDAAKARPDFQREMEIEAEFEAEMEKALEGVPVWEEVLKPVVGMGPAIAARFISTTLTIQRFPTKAKMKAFCGVHVMPDGTFARRREGATANWSPAARQALLLFGNQCLYRKDSPWGQVLRKYKEKFQARHPVVECSKCRMAWEQCVDPQSHKRRYTKAHILKMAFWRTVTKFVEAIWKTWWDLEQGTLKEKGVLPPVPNDTATAAVPLSAEESDPTQAAA